MSLKSQKLVASCIPARYLGFYQVENAWSTIFVANMWMLLRVNTRPGVLKIVRVPLSQTDNYMVYFLARSADDMFVVSNSKPEDLVRLTV